MWRISDRERTILGNLMQVCAAEDDDAPTNPFERIEIPFERRNGETVRVSLEDVMKVVFMLALWMRLKVEQRRIVSEGPAFVR
jgi:hypothetical protein